ncbi:MAG: uracil-DNA glycosylase [Desulfarculaceae bacterium]|nr:uracil-DNA glycosylase [Desulfarculaceae bacterium]
MDQLMAAVMPSSPAPRLGSLQDVQAWLGECARCSLSETRHKIVFGAGPENARIMFIGEGPGQREDQQGLPFVGPAGKLLDAMLAAVGLQRSQVYITNIVKCRPPGNRDPQPGEVAACRPFLEAQVKQIAPAAICALGRPAAQALLATDAPIGRLRGRWASALGVPVLPTYHPAYLLRTPEAKGLAYNDLKALVRGPEH